MADLSPVDCRFYHEDSHRQATRRACRLIQRNPQSPPWQRGLCNTCPVPGLLAANPCIHLALEATVVRKMGVFQRVQPYAVCTAKILELEDPASCWRGCDQFRPQRLEGETLVSVDDLLASIGDQADDR